MLLRQLLLSVGWLLFWLVGKLVGARMHQGGSTSTQRFQGRGGKTSV